MTTEKMYRFLHKCKTQLELIADGYYQFEGRDKENWPHFKLLKAIPAISDREQQHLIKEAMIDYFIANEYYLEEKPLN